MIGNNLKQLRKEKGLTLESLAKKAGVSKAHIWTIEKGNSPKLDTVYKIARALDISIDLLIDITIDKTSTNERTLIRRYRKLSDRDQKLLLGIAKIFHEIDEKYKQKEGQATAL